MTTRDHADLHGKTREQLVQILRDERATNAALSHAIAHLCADNIRLRAAEVGASAAMESEIVRLREENSALRGELETLHAQVDGLLRRDQEREAEQLRRDTERDAERDAMQLQLAALVRREQERDAEGAALKALYEGATLGCIFRDRVIAPVLTKFDMSWTALDREYWASVDGVADGSKPVDYFKGWMPDVQRECRKHGVDLVQLVEMLSDRNGDAHPGGQIRTATERRRFIDGYTAPPSGWKYKRNVDRMLTYASAL